MSQSPSSHPSLIKDLSQFLFEGAKAPQGWRLKAVVNDDNMTYVAGSETTREAIIVDPMIDDWEALTQVTRQHFEGYRFVAVIDTHTHADHISCAAALADFVKAPLVMHEKAPSRKIHLRVSRDVELPTQAGGLRILLTPGHTQDSLTPLWGPFLFTGDTIIHGDTGRDDLPTGDPAAHYESLQKIKAVARAEQIFLTGHDAEGGRASTWATQLKLNASLSQDRETFVREAGSYVGPSPKLLKESLFENFK
jgi:glyoxylase-like metal-dependent hydrolase (beta-lactamase superfamily II)